MKQKQNHGHREQTGCCQGEGSGQGWSGRLGLAGKTSTYGMDAKQGPTVAHRELYSTSYEKPQWKRIYKKECI